MLSLYCKEQAFLRQVIYVVVKALFNVSCDNMCPNVLHNQTDPGCVPQWVFMDVIKSLTKSIVINVIYQSLHEFYNCFIDVRILTSVLMSHKWVTSLGTDLTHPYKN